MVAAYRLSLHPPQGNWLSTGDRLRLTPSSMPIGACGSEAGQPAYVGHRLQHHHATLETALEPFDLQHGDLAGLALVQNEYGHYVLGVERDEVGLAVSVYRRSGRDGAKQGDRLARVPLPAFDAPLSFRFQLDVPGLGAAYRMEGGEWKKVANGLDASLLSVDTAGGFIGNTFGPYAFRP